jgi:hypothetical protein
MTRSTVGSFLLRKAVVVVVVVIALFVFLVAGENETCYAVGDCEPCPDNEVT